MTDTALAGMEHHIARGRILLSLAAIVSVYVDPTTPDLTHWIAVRGGLFMIDGHALAILILHGLYAVGIYAAQAGWPAHQAWISRWSIAFDVLFGVAVAVVTEGATSPAYAFFAFGILAVGCRSGFHATLAVSAACVAVYLGLILISAQHGANIYMMRPVYLAITGYLIAYLAERRLDCETRAREAETRAERQGIARALHDGHVQALAAVNIRLENCRTLLGRGRADDALAELAALQSGIRYEYDEVRAYIRSLADLERRTTPPIGADPQLTVSAHFAGSAVLVEHVLHIMLEGVRNARRHAQATSTAISTCETERGVQIAIEDDGVGFGKGADVPWTIASRARECGGDARIAGPTRHGGCLVVELPAR